MGPVELITLIALGAPAAIKFTREMADESGALYQAIFGRLRERQRRKKLEIWGHVFQQLLALLRDQAVAVRDMEAYAHGDSRNLAGAQDDISGL
jgi:hypothetical protein